MIDILRIEWNLGNSCNLKCSYCSKELNDGTNAFPNLEVLCPAFDHLLDQTRAFSSVEIEITGGEPTESLALKQIIENTCDPRIKFKLISNGSADITWWKSIKHKLFGLQLTYHQIANLYHFSDIVQELKDIRPRVLIALTPETWETQKQVYNLFRTSGHDVHMQLLYSNFTKGNSEYLKYSKEQWDEYYRSEGIDPTATQEVVQTIEFKRINHLNNYFGHLCWAGVNQIVIDNFGDAWRGWCKANEPMGNIYKKTLELDRQPRVCPRSQCKNGFDLQARKSENSWGIA